MEYTYDFHLHSCLSPCASDDMTPQNIANMAALAGYDIIAVADHNTTLHARAVMEAADRAGIIAVPAMELTTQEEVHVLCLLPDLDAAEAFGAYVWDRLPDIPNRRDIFGAQMQVDSRDVPVREIGRLLISATNIGIYEVYDLIRSYGGTAMPCHVDRGSFSVISNLGFYDADMGFPAIELTEACDGEAFCRAHPSLQGLKHYVNSDAHSLEAIPDAKRRIVLSAPTAGAVIRAIEGKCL
ncbi:MAG: hypothetical protein FWE08_05860 [Oscillospiraceae bacterium]|nr:hypothetical protein [Oscillospiraceae bacterium]